MWEGNVLYLPPPERKQQQNGLRKQQFWNNVVLQRPEKTARKGAVSNSFEPGSAVANAGPFLHEQIHDGF